MELAQEQVAMSVDAIALTEVHVYMSAFGICMQLTDRREYVSSMTNAGCSVIRDTNMSFWVMVARNQ
jgi:hypothetical protein